MEAQAIHATMEQSQDIMIEATKQLATPNRLRDQWWTLEPGLKRNSKHKLIQRYYILIFSLKGKKLPEV